MLSEHYSERISALDIGDSLYYCIYGIAVIVIVEELCYRLGIGLVMAVVRRGVVS